MQSNQVAMTLGPRRWPGMVGLLCWLRGSCALILAILILAPFSPPVWAEWHQREAAIMGTNIRVEVWHPDPALAAEAMSAVLSEMRRIDALMSPYRPDSELSAMNQRASAQPVEVSSEMLQLLLRAAHFSELSGGAFDVTFASAGHLYDFRAGERPDAEVLSERLPAIDYRHLLLDMEAGTVRYTHPDVVVDLGGIGKGHAVDNAIALLEARGIETGMVAAGGDTRILGDRRGRPWTVGIRDPDDPARMLALLPLIDTAISTSGDYERYFDDDDGLRHHHILNPETGKSARGVRSATVIGPSATDTDALSTAIFVLGPEAGIALIESLPDYDAVIIDASGQVYLSSELAGASDGT
jgi:FAD:protein FMN transferase